MIAYKLFRQRKDGSLGSLFINRRRRLSIGEWMNAEIYPTSEFALRPGWHCTTLPIAPHLSMKGRIWCVVKIEDFTRWPRPKAQGGEWLLANKMMILGDVGPNEKEY